MRIFSMLADAFGARSVPLLTSGQSFPGHPGGPPSLPRGQAPARGLIGAWSRDVGNKSPSRRDRHRAAVAMLNEQFQTKAKPVKARKPKPHPVYHPCDIDGGAVTLVGRNPRRTWLGGFSAQRGY
jgi:hypothetical protein